MTNGPRTGLSGERYMVLGSRHVGFLIYLTDSLIITFIYLFSHKRVVWVNTRWVLYILLASGITRRLGTCLEATCVKWGDWSIEEGVCQLEVVTHPVAQRQTLSNLMQRQRQSLCTYPDGGETGQELWPLQGTACSHYRSEVLLVWKRWPTSCTHHSNCDPLLISGYPASAFGTCCCLCLECPFPPNLFFLTFQTWVESQLSRTVLPQSPPCHTSACVFVTHQEWRRLPSRATKACAPALVCLCH